MSTKYNIQNKGVFVLGENHFRKYFSRNAGVWLVRKIEFSGNWFPLTEKKGFDYENEFPFLFSLQMISGTETRKESSQMRKGSSQMRKGRTRERERTISRTRKGRKIMSSIVISPLRWSRSREAPRRSRLRLRRAISPLVEPSRLSLFPLLSIWSDLMIFFFWVLSVFFWVLALPSSFPNTRKYFSKFFLKCNQTHENIFLSGNAFTRTKHSLKWNSNQCLWSFCQSFDPLRGNG